MRVILLTHGGAELVLERVAALDNVEMVGVFIENLTAPKRSFAEKIRRSLKYDGLIETLKKAFPFGVPALAGPAVALRPAKAGTPNDPTIAMASQLRVTLYEVENFHSDSSLDLIANAKADLGIIFGTNIIRENVFSLPRLGSINLHQGLAPHYRGGPPIFWELFNDEKEVGITVHYVAAKVDTGDIILQKSVPLEYDFTYRTNFEDFISTFQAGLREESANLIAESVKLIASCAAPRKPQDISIGKRYRLPLKKEKDEMRRSLRERSAQRENAKS